MKTNEIEEYKEISDSEIDEFASIYSSWAKQHKKIFYDANRKYPKDRSLYEPIEIYAGYGARDINSYLRGLGDGIEVHESLRFKWEGVVTTIRLSILSAPRIPSNMLVYRWVPKSVIEDMISRRDLSYREYGFLSTSLIPDARPEHVNSEYELIQIKVDSGTPAIFVDTIVQRSEYELLFLDDCILKYEAKEYDKRAYRDVYVVRLTYYPVL